MSRPGHEPREVIILRGAALLLAVLSILATGCASDEGTPRSGATTTSQATPSPPNTSEPTTILPFSAGPVDWNNRSSVDIALPTGWHLAACEGDAPFLCASTADGTIDGSIMLLEYPAPAAPPSRDEVEAEAAELYRVTEADRRTTCGSDYHLTADRLSAVTVGGQPGYRYGYQLRDAAGTVTERVILHVVHDNSRQIVINTAFSDPAGCPGEDPERNEFPIEALAAIDPYLDRIVAQSILPSSAGPS
jgi:hypothetical protein